MIKDDENPHEQDKIRNTLSKMTVEQRSRLEYYCERRSILEEDPDVLDSIDECSSLILKNLLKKDEIVLLIHHDKKILADIAIETNIALVDLFIKLKDIVYDQSRNTATRH